MTEQPYLWEFRARLRRHAFGWRSQPAVQRVKQAVSEVKAVARQDQKTRERWLDRLWAAHEADKIPYVERLADHWGELCISKEVASRWADELLGITRMALSPDPKLHGHFRGTAACLSALYTAVRYGEIVDILQLDTIWPYKRWAVRTFAAMGKKAEAIRYAESCRSPWASDHEIDSMCEGILLPSGLIEEAVELASSGPCDPKTLIRAARDFAQKEPGFSVEVGLLALRWLGEGYGYEVTRADVWHAYTHLMGAASSDGRHDETRKRVSEIVGSEAAAGFVKSVLGRELGL